MEATGWTHGEIAGLDVRVFWRYLEYFDAHPPVAVVARWYLGIDEAAEEPKKPTLAQLMALARA